jgi:hypothetical protein
MKLIVLALAASMGLAVIPQHGFAQNRTRELERREAEIREARRQEEQAKQRRQRLEREAEAVRRSRVDRRDVDDRIADVLLGRRTRDRDDIYRDRNIYRDRDVRVKRNGNGPPFCRNGQGHPVHGRQWCRDKGWGLGDSRIDRDVRVDRRERVSRRDRDRDRGVQERIGDIMRGRTR